MNSTAKAALWGRFGAPVKQTAHKLDDVDLLIVAVLTGIVGLGLGIAGILAFRFSERSRDAADLHSEDDLPEGIAEVLAVLPSAAIVLDAGDDVVKASPAAYTFGLVRGHSLASPEMLRMVERVRSRGLIEEIELEQKREQTDSVLRFLHARVAPLGTNFVLVLCDDQTESKRVDAVRRDFVANVSHELKTPVGALSLLAETMGDAADDAEAVRRFGGQMRREADRLAVLVQEIIDLSRLQEPDALVGTALVAIDDVVAEARDRVRVEAEARRISVLVGGLRGCCVLGDADLLTTAVRNLLDNALRYSAPLTQVSVAVGAEAGMVTIAVVDQGEGIAPAEQRRVFERFYRGDPARARKTGGSGLGLSIVKHVAADHGGEVEVWSKPGAGSTFTLRLPMAQSPAPTETEETRPQ